MLKIRPKISEKQAKKLIIDMCKNAEHSKHHLIKDLNTNKIELWFTQNGYEFNKLVSSIRNWDESIPLVESLIGPTFHIESNGSNSHTSIVDSSDNSYSTLEGAGVINSSDYQAKIFAAAKHKQDAIRSASLEDFYSCLSKTFASMESYFYLKAYEYNKLNPNNVLVDNKETPVPLEDKIKSWIPIMTDDKSINISGKSWSLFKDQQKLRNDNAIHPKSIATACSYTDMAKLINNYRDGIISVFYNIHIAFGDKMKSKLIREAYFPDIYVEESV